MPELGDAWERIRAVGGDTDVWPRLLIRLRGEPDVVEAVVLAVIGEGRLGPRPLEDFESFGKALAALAVRDAVGLVGAREAAAPDSEYQAALADLVDRRGLFGQPQRMAEWQYLNAGPHLHAFGAGGYGTGESERRRAHRPVGVDVDFRQPHRVEPPALGGIDLFERGGERLLVTHTGGPLKLVEHPELERHSLLLLLRAAAYRVDPKSRLDATLDWGGNPVKAGKQGESSIPPLTICLWFSAINPLNQCL